MGNAADPHQDLCVGEADLQQGHIMVDRKS